MNLRSQKNRKPDKAFEYLNETEKTQLAIRAAFAKNKVRQGASRNASGIGKKAVKGKLFVKPKQSS